MTEYHNNACIIVDLDKLPLVNAHFLKHGYGPNNVNVPMILTGDSDDADPKAYAAEAPVNNGIMALLKIATFLDGFTYKVGERGESLLDDFAAENGYRRKPRVEV